MAQHNSTGNSGEDLAADYLVAKGYFIVERNFTQIISFCSLDILSEEDRLKRDLFTKGEELLATDLDAVEREYLLKRLSELNTPSNVKR